MIRRDTPLLVLMLASITSIAFADSSGAWRDGREAYEKICARCHETGVSQPIRGRSAPDVTRAIVRRGFNQMPAFRVTEIDDSTLEQLLEFLQGAGGDT